MSRPRQHQPNVSQMCHGPDTLNVDSNRHYRRAPTTDTRDDDSSNDTQPRTYVTHQFYGLHRPNSCTARYASRVSFSTGVPGGLSFAHVESIACTSCTACFFNFLQHIYGTTASSWHHTMGYYYIIYIKNIKVKVHTVLLDMNTTKAPVAARWDKQTRGANTRCNEVQRETRDAISPGSPTMQQNPRNTPMQQTHETHWADAKRDMRHGHAARP